MKTGEFRNWLDLPDVLLVSILNRLLSVRDLLAFASVCRLWRSLFKSTTTTDARADSSSSFPPLLLQCLDRSNLYRCSFQLRDTINPLLSFRSKMVYDHSYRRDCIGYSYGHLLFQFANRGVLLVDVFTGEELLSPDYPDPDYAVRFGLLTAPPSSPSSVLVLTNYRYFKILYWRPGGVDGWSEFEFRIYPPTSDIYMRSLIAFRGQVFSMASTSQLILFDFFPRPTWKKLGAPLSHPPLVYTRDGRRVFNNPSLVECSSSSNNGEQQLMSILFPDSGGGGSTRAVKIEVHRFDFVEIRWRKTEDLGESWCLFLDAAVRNPILCRKPERWGGRGGQSMYLAGPRFDTWIVIPLDDTPLNDAATTSSRSSSSPLLQFSWMDRWPSSVWVYPSVLYSRFVSELAHPP